MPGMSGIEALKHLESNGKTAPPTVICSMHRASGFVEAAMEAGAVGYVYKARAPFDLADAVDAALEGRRYVSTGVGGSHTD